MYTARPRSLRRCARVPCRAPGRRTYTARPQRRDEAGPGEMAVGDADLPGVTPSLPGGGVGVGVEQHLVDDGPRPSAGRRSTTTRGGEGALRGVGGGSSNRSTPGARAFRRRGGRGTVGCKRKPSTAHTWHTFPNARRPEVETIV
ncbi:hypothetical protein LX36DRAFT_132880 [Colletotrichum falcatum]|nr:hypothetical protein LX36DRAFT_132880 [Colletotrichum falcatum]